MQYIMYLDKPLFIAEVIFYITMCAYIEILIVLSFVLNAWI